MRKWARVAFLVVLFSVSSAVVVCECRRQPEPVYGGKLLSRWIYGPISITNLSETYTMGIPKLDSRAVPILMRYLEVRDGPLKRLYVATYPTLREWITKWLPRPWPDQNVRFYSILALGTIGPDAKPAIPALIRILRSDPNPRVRFPAILALARIGQKDESVRTALLGVLSYPSEDISLQAATALIDDPSCRSEVAIVLRRNLTNSTPYYREWATNLFQRGGFEGSASVR